MDNYAICKAASRAESGFVAEMRGIRTVTQGLGDMNAHPASEGVEEASLMQFGKFREYSVPRAAGKSPVHFSEM
ncbi:hypothetical protein NXY56_005525 [Leishmania guyanensis]